MRLEQIMLGKQDVMFAGGGEELDWTLSCLFDAMGAMSSKYNDTPQQASRAFDANRDGFVISGGGGIVVLEELEHAQGARRQNLCRGDRLRRHQRRARHGGTLRRGRRACHAAGPVHPARWPQALDISTPMAPRTPVGDVGEVEAVRRVFGQGTTPPISSTKSMTGHAQGAAGALEAIFSLLMLDNDFIARSINVETLDPAAGPVRNRTGKR